MNKNKQTEKEIADALNECMESMLTRSESVESCLERFPLHAAELKPLLETVKAARAASSLSADETFRTRARCEFRSALYDNPNKARGTRPGLALRWATAFSAIGLVILTGAGGAVAASANSMPGQPLYQLKRDVENVQLTLTPSQEGKARLYAAMADQRVSEIVYAAQSGNVQLTQNLTDQFTSDLSMVSTIVTSSVQTVYGNVTPPSTNGSSPQKSTTPTTTNTIVGTSSAISSQSVVPFATAAPTATAPPVTIAVAPVPSIIVTNPPRTNVTVSPPVSTLAVPGSLSPNQPIILPPQPTTLSGITDPALLKLLQQYSVKNIAQLMSILDNVPPSTKAALLAAIQAATSDYGQILGT